MKRLLVIAAHPDDEVLGCGGTIARLTQESAEVRTVILGEGAVSRGDGSVEVRALETAAREAGGVLGVSQVLFNGLPDNRFDSLNLLDVVKIIEGHIDAFRPDTVLTHHGADLNVDHCVTFRAVLTATRPLPNTSVRKVLSFEVPSSSEWSFSKVGAALCPNYFFDISSTLQKKLDALAKYNAEMRAFPHPRSMEAVEALAMSRGAIVGVDAAEAFEVVRWLE